MTKKVAAVLLVVGLVLPHSCGIRPLTGAWDGLASAVMLGIPVLVTLAYALHQLLPALARFHERHGAALHGVFRAVYFVLAGVYLASGLDEDTERRGKIAVAAALLVTGVLLYWQQGRGTKAQRLPLLLLTVVGVAAVWAFTDFVTEGLQYGGWVFTAGWALAVGAEVAGLRGAPRVSHGG